MIGQLLLQARLGSTAQPLKNREHSVDLVHITAFNRKDACLSGLALVT